MFTLELFAMECKGREEDLEKLVKGVGVLGVRIVELLANEKGGSLVKTISPLSIAVVLGMIAAGAKGESKAEILRLMRLEDSEFHVQHFKALVDAGSASDSVKLQIANSVWSLVLSPEFISLCQRAFGADAKAEAPTAAAINGWCSRATNGLITEILSEDPSPDGAVLINAIHFKGSWKDPFKMESTTKQPFSRFDSSQVTVDMMYQRIKSLRYFEDSKVQAISLPYGSDDEMSAVLILPQEKQPISAAIHFMSGDVFFSRATVNVHIPKLLGESTFDLKSMLSTLGISTIFSSTADLSGASGKPLHVSGMAHKTYLKVDEKGTEAAAVTAGIMDRLCFAPLEDVKTFRCDRPFLFLVRMNATGTWAFASVVG